MEEYLKRDNPFSQIYKNVNNGSNQKKYEQFKRGKSNLLPSLIDIELTNLCNYKCCFCPTGTNAMQRIKGMMPDNVVDAIIENLNRYKIGGVRFIRWGEPTMHPKYLEIIERVKKTGTLVHINTNGSRLDDKQIKKLLDINLDSIKFSFQGADEGTYNEIRENGDYVQLLKTIRRFYELRAEKKLPFIQVSTTLTNETKDQIESFKSDVGNICDYVNIGYTVLNHLSVGQMNISNGQKKKIIELQKREVKQRKYMKVCNEAFDKLSINWNGDITLCCSDYDNFMIVGNILDNDIKQIFNCRAADIYREIIANGEYGKIKCCSTCYEVIPLDK
ncbi:4Fe-4S single cluster domain-containing protein [Lachnospiraceae bacterium]|nr:4Fe-4S single cluster domain-containing protein [Lachnospiraceae bacterium]